MTTTDTTVPRRRIHVPTQGYSEPDDAYRDRVETKAISERVERADSQRVIVSLSAAEILGL